VEIILIVILIAYALKNEKERVTAGVEERKKNRKAYQAAQRNYVRIGKQYGKGSKELAAAKRRLDRAKKKVSWWQQ
jgi:predicted  nucleic acid-binding Zn-ribbon protein